LNILDGVFILILGYTLIRGLSRGLVMECASIAGLVTGFLIANSYYPLLSEFLFKITQFRFINIVSYALIFLAVLVGCILVGSIFRKILQVVMLLWLDRIGGGLFGFGKGFIFCVVILMLLIYFVPSTSLVKESKIVPYMYELSRSFTHLVPEDMKESILKGNKDLREWFDIKLDDLDKRQG